MKLFAKKSGGFTLVELLAVVAIIGILLMLAVPKFGDITRASQVRVLQNNTRSVVSAVLLYQAENNGEYPPAGLLDTDYQTNNPTVSLALPAGYFDGSVGPGPADDCEYELVAAGTGNGYTVTGSASINDVGYTFSYDMNEGVLEQTAP